jgi:hypothetical protein
VLALARALAREQRGEDRLAGQRRREVVGRRDAQVLRRAAEALHRHDPAHGLQQRVEAGAVAVGAVGAERRDRRVDDARVEAPERGVVDAEPMHHARTHVLHHHVGAHGQAVHDGAAVGRLQVEGDGPLAPVPAVEARQLAEGVALERFHLDDGGAHVGQHHGAVGAGDVGREIDDPDAGERCVPGAGHAATWRTISSRWNSASP